jgi:hypothetical protein
VATAWRLRGDCVATAWRLRGVCGTAERKAFSYNKRTMDRAMGPFSPF